MESRTQISENGNVILYEKRYHGVLTENGSVRLKAYCAKRIPLGTVSLALQPWASERYAQLFLGACDRRQVPKAGFFDRRTAQGRCGELSRK